MGAVRPGRTLLGAVAVTSALLGMAGCRSASTSDPAQDSAYLSEVHDAAPDISGLRTDTQLIRLGHAACDGFAGGASYAQLADRLALLEGARPLPSQDLGAVITSAADNYCPQYRNRVS